MSRSPLPVRRGPKRALSEDAILDAALALLDDGGTAAASIRGIAARLGVAPNAVYTYFPDKDAVVRALVERLLGDVDRDVFTDRTQPWRARVEALAVDLRERLTRHPGAVPFVIGTRLDGPHARTLSEHLLELLTEAGLDATEAARAAYALIVYVLGSLALEVADAGRPGRLPPEAERVAERRAAFAATPVDRYPRTADAAPAMAAYVGTEQYLWGLHRLLDGIAAP